MNCTRRVLSLSLFAFWGIANGQITDTLLLNEVKVQDSRYPAKFSETARNMTVLLPEEIKSMPVLSVQDVLSYLNSVDIRQRGVGGVQADVSMRGGNFDQCLILIDGVKMTDPQTGHHLLNLPINPADIERIEVLRGPGSRIFGQNAFAGTINIITKKDYSKSANASFMAGDFGTYQYGAGASFQTKKGFGNRISINRTQSAGYGPNLDFNINQALYQGRYLLESGAYLSAMAGYQSKNFGAQNFYTPPVAKFKEYEETQTIFATLSGQFIKAKNLRVNLNWRQHGDEFRLWRDSLHKGINFHTTNVFSVDANMYHQSKLGTTSWGGEFRIENIESSNLGNRNRNIGGLFFEHRFSKFNNINAVIGTNLSYISGYGWIPFPGADVSYDLIKNVKVYASVGRSYRVPTFTDLYYTDAGPSSLGNSSLAPESAWTYEGGFKYNKNRFAFSANYFIRDAETLIDWQKEQASQPWMAVNVSNVSTQGIETELNYQPKSDWVKRVRIAYSFIDVSKIKTPLTSRYVYDYLKSQLILSTEFAYGKRITHGIFYRYQERASYPSAHLLDTRVNVQIQKHLSGFVMIENITNTKYYGSTYVQMPTRWLRVGGTVKF